MERHILAGQLVQRDQIVNLARLMAEFYQGQPLAPVAFGTSGHRGTPFKGAFNEPHVAAITQAVVEYRQFKGHKGPLYLGYDTHALSEGAWRVALEVLAAQEVPTIISQDQEYSPTPVISFLILEHNRRNPRALADGIIITPSHNPPQDGGLKYNPPHGGPADVDVTGWIEKRANELLKNPQSIKRVSLSRALTSSNVKAENFITPFTEALGQVVDMEAISGADLMLGVDPMGGSGVHFWRPIAERWKLKVRVVNPIVDPSFSFMTLDADGIVRMDCSSPYAMANLLHVGSEFDLAFGNDPDFDRHGIVSGGKLMNPNHYLATAISYLLENRPQWPQKAKIGKTTVSSSVINRVVAGAGREVFETPVGFKWFVEGLLNKTLLFGGEESAGATFLRMDGTPWTTDKDGFSMTLLAAEMMAKTGRSPHEIYQSLTEKYGSTDYARVDSNLTDEDKTSLANFKVDTLVGKKCAGLPIVEAWSKAPGNQASIGGLKAILSDGSWFALRPSGTEPKMKFYVESFSGLDFQAQLIQEAQALVFGQ
jgi:phosphoglucomutase